MDEMRPKRTTTLAEVLQYKAIYPTNTNGNHFDVVANVEKREYCPGDFSDNNELSDSI